MASGETDSGAAQWRVERSTVRPVYVIHCCENKWHPLPPPPPPPGFHPCHPRNPTTGISGIYVLWNSLPDWSSVARIYLEIDVSYHIDMCDLFSVRCPCFATAATCLPIYPSFYLPVSLSSYLSFLPTICYSAPLSSYLTFSLTTCLPICPSF